MDGVSRREAAKMKRRETSEEVPTAAAASSKDHRPPEDKPRSKTSPSDRVLFQSFTRPLPIHHQTIIFTFQITSYEEPQEGDWIGLFRVRQNIPDSCNDISFVWAKDDSILLSDGIYQTSLRLYNDEDLEPDALFCLSYVTTGCDFIGYSKKFWIRNNWIIPEDDVVVSDAAPKCHLKCYDNDGNHDDETNPITIHSLNDWLAHISNTAYMERNKMTKTQNGSDDIPDEFCHEDPKTTSLENTERTGSRARETGSDNACAAGDEVTLNKCDFEERRSSTSKPDVINVSFNVNNNINRAKSLNVSPAVDRCPNLGASNCVLKEKIAEALSSDRVFPENPKESSSTSSAEVFFEAVHADDVFNSLYSELSVAHNRIETLAEELRHSVVANKLLEEQLGHFKSTTATHGDELSSCSAQINSQTQKLKEYAEKSMGWSDELKDLTNKNEHLLNELNCQEKERAEVASDELASLKNDFKMLSGELEKKKAELNEIQMLEADRLSEIESLKEKLEAQAKEVKILKNLKTWESLELKRLKLEITSKQTELKLIKEQDRSKAVDLKQLEDQLQTRCEEVNSIKAMIQSQNHALNRVRHLLNSKNSDDSCSTLDASVELNVSNKDPCQMELKSGNSMAKKLQCDLSAISDILHANETGTEQLKVEILGLLTELQRLQMKNTAMSGQVLQLKEANDCKLEEMASMKHQLSANFQKFHSNQMFLSTKLLRSKVNEQLLTKTLEKLRKKDEDSTELLKASEEFRKRCLDEKEALQKDFLQLQSKSEMLETEFQRNLVSRDDVRNKLKVEEILTANLSAKLQQFEDKLNQASDKLIETETRAENFLTELRTSRERESKLNEEMHQMKLQLETSLTDLRDSEESLRLLSAEAESLKSSNRLLTAELEKSKASEQALLSELQRMSDDMVNRDSQNLSVNRGTVSEEDADFTLSRSKEKEGVTKSGCYGNCIEPPVEKNTGEITQHSEAPLLSSSPSLPLNWNSSAKKDEKASNENLSAVSGKTLSIEVDKDLKAADASSRETLSDQSSTNNFSSRCKQNHSSSSNANNVIPKPPAAAENEQSKVHVDGSTSQSNVIRELEQQVAQQSEEILQYQEKLKSLLSDILFQNQRFCCENGNGLSRVSSLSARNSTAETASSQLRREQKFREDLLAWNELNNKQLMEHISMVQNLIFKSPALIEKLYHSSCEQLNADSKICAKGESQNGSASGQNGVVCDASTVILPSVCCREESESTAKSHDNATIGNGIRNRKLHARDAQKLSNSNKTDCKASALPRPSNNFRNVMKRLNCGSENSAGEDHRTAKSGSLEPFGRCSASTDDVKEVTNVRMFRRMESQNLDARSLVHLTPGLARRQPSQKSSTALKKLKEIDQSEFRNGNMPMPTACSDPIEHQEDCSTSDPLLPNQRPAKTAFHRTQPNSKAKYCVSMPKTRTNVTNNTDANARVERSEREWFCKDQEQDAAYEALKRIGINLNYFLESLTDVQPEKISLDVVHYPTTEDASDISDLDAYGDDFRIPNYHLMSTPASPEKSNASSKTKYNLQFPVSHLRELTFPSYVESVNRNLHVHNASVGVSNGANESMSSVSLFANNTVASSSRNEVVAVKTQQGPKYFKIDSKSPGRKSDSGRPKIKAIPEQRHHSLRFMCPLVAAEGDATVSIDRPADCTPDATYSKKCDSADNEHMPTYTADGNSEPVSKHSAPGGKRRPCGYADLVNRRVVCKASGKRNNQGAVTKRILPAKQPCRQVDRVTKASN